MLTELQNHWVERILIACVDGLRGFPDAINTAFPPAKIQLCIIHMVRNSLKYVPWKNYKETTADLKRIYQSATEQEACTEIDCFTEKWDDNCLSGNTICIRKMDYANKKLDTSHESVYY